jgi:hypothetical protein
MSGRSPKPSIRWRYGPFFALACPLDMLTRRRLRGSGPLFTIGNIW